jgi:tRNA A37 threonylcarbamoyladenosine dehydratase
MYNFICVSNSNRQNISIITSIEIKIKKEKITLKKPNQIINPNIVVRQIGF